MLSSYAYAYEVGLNISQNEVFEASFKVTDNYKDNDGQILSTKGGLGLGVLGNSNFLGGYLSLAEKHPITSELTWLTQADFGYINGYIEKDSKSYFIRLNQGISFKNIFYDSIEDGLGVYLWVNIFEDRELAKNKSVNQTDISPYYSVSILF